MEGAKDCEALLDLEEKVQRARKGEALEELLRALLASSCLERADARLWARAFERAGRRDLTFRFLRGCLESGQGCRGVEDVIRGLGTTRKGRAFLAEVARALADKGFLENTSPPYWASVLFQQAPEVLTARMPSLLKRILREGEEPNASYARHLSTVLEHRPTPRGEAPLWLEAIRRFPHFEEEREALTRFYRDFLQEVPPEALKPTHVFLLAVLPLPENVLLNVWRAVLRDLDPRKDLYGPGTMPDFRVLVRWIAVPSVRKEFFASPRWVSAPEEWLRHSPWYWSEWAHELARHLPEDLVFRWVRNRNGHLRALAAASGRLPHALLVNLKNNDRAGLARQEAEFMLNRIRQERIYRVLRGRGLLGPEEHLPFRHTDRYRLHWIVKGRLAYVSAQRGSWYLVGRDAAAVLPTISLELGARTLPLSHGLKRLFQERVPLEAVERLFFQVLTSKPRLDKEALLSALEEWLEKEDLPEEVRREVGKEVLAGRIAHL